MGPFAVEKRIGATAYRLAFPAGGRYSGVHPVFHVSLLRRHVPGGAAAAPPEPVFCTGELEWEVQDIVRHRRCGNSRQLQYLVRFVGFDSGEDQWYHEDELPHVRAILAKYKEDHGLV